MLNRILRRLGLMSEGARFVGHAKTRDVAFTYRMGAGSPGDVTRVGGLAVEPVLLDVTSPPLQFGTPLILDSASHNARRFTAGDTAVTAAYGWIVRPYPTQQNTATPALGTATPPVSGPADLVRSGYILSALPTGAGAVVKGGIVYVWCAADSGNHKQGGIEDAASGGNTAALANATFNGPADANGVVEIAVNV